MKDNTDLIEAYFNNELLDDDLLDFEKMLVVEPDLADEVGLHRQIRGFVKENEVGNLKSQVKEWLKEEAENEVIDEPRILNSQKPKASFSIRLLTKIAAGIAIVSGLSWYFFSNKTAGNLENQYLSELTNQNPAQLQGVDDRSVWAQAYRDKKYKQVISILQNKKNVSAEEIYYLGLALSADYQFDKALVELSKKTVTNSVYAEKAEWAKALIYLKISKNIEAKTLLKKIESSDSEFKEKAKLIDL